MLKTVVRLCLQCIVWLQYIFEICIRFLLKKRKCMTLKLALQWLPCQAPGVIGSALRLVGPVSVYCDWVRWKV